MPNWCSNFAEFTHADPAQVQRVFAAYKRGELFKEFDPCPPELLETTAGSFGDADQQAALELQEAANLDEYGYKNWYDWCVANWGTKWDVAEVWQDAEAPEPGDTMIGISFDTAWAPPIEFYRTMTDEHGFTVEAHYLEEGVGFVGKYTSEDDDDCYEFEDIDLTTVPKDICDHWDLEDIMVSRAMWDVDEDDDEDEEPEGAESAE
jgi:hypothetical protein